MRPRLYRLLPQLIFSARRDNLIGTRLPRGLAWLEQTSSYDPPAYAIAHRTEAPGAFERLPSWVVGVLLASPWSWMATPVILLLSLLDRPLWQYVSPIMLLSLPGWLLIAQWPFPVGLVVGGLLVMAAWLGLQGLHQERRQMYDLSEPRSPWACLRGRQA